MLTVRHFVMQLLCQQKITKGQHIWAQLSQSPAPVKEAAIRCASASKNLAASWILLGFLKFASQHMHHRATPSLWLLSDLQSRAYVSSFCE